MTIPKITFFCELEADQLSDVFTDQIINDLLAMDASISLGLLDLSLHRVELIKKLNQAGVPVIAWLLLPKSQGYWFNLDNVDDAQARLMEFLEWTEEHRLIWDGIGLDIEPDIRDFMRFTQDRRQLLSEAVRRIFNFHRFRTAKRKYLELSAQIHAEGYRIDSYQFPIIEDERQAQATILQRVAGLIDLPVDREVWMLYSSFLRPHGAGVIASYAPQAQSIGLGSTGGGVELDIVEQKPLSWQEFSRDLRLGWFYCEDIHIFSLEGCLQQGFFERLKGFSWGDPILTPDESRLRVDRWRWTLRIALWFIDHLGAVILFSLTAVLFKEIFDRLLRKKD